MVKLPDAFCSFAFPVHPKYEFLYRQRTNLILDSCAGKVKKYI